MITTQTIVEMKSIGSGVATVEYATIRSDMVIGKNVTAHAHAVRNPG
jgi:UDP-3-O-[3-hydroxymyristoyl] glucosamine N-acyltransferase